MNIFSKNGVIQNKNRYRYACAAPCGVVVATFSQLLGEQNHRDDHGKTLLRCSLANQKKSANSAVDQQTTM